MPVTPALEIEGLTVRYGETTAVDGLDLRIAPGQTVALLGRCPGCCSRCSRSPTS
jgi:ABC-2 type transport system ATP-binding protein